ncbi:MAG: excinuclease ABC subunit UvrA [Gemmatimonadetes bacterium]|nr:excinuclease ABC subunit UvrA [Gemmatimonadota bacterium]
MDWEKVFPEKTSPLSAHPVAPFNSPSYRSNYGWLKKSCEQLGVPWNVPLDELTDEQMELLKFGRGTVEGVKEFFDWLDQERYKVQSRIMVARYRGYTPCPKCRGTRLVQDALNVFWSPEDGTLSPRHIGEVSRLALTDLLLEFEGVTLTHHEDELIGRVFREILSRLQYLVHVGLGYLTLDRQTRTLSGGEAQRINLATALGTALTRTLYVLDEPTVGLHPRDSRRLLTILRALRDRGNTVIVVEHDPELILGADNLLDIGPKAGSGGGEIIFAGTPDQLLASGAGSLTAQYLPRGSSGNAPKRKTSRTSKKVPAPELTGPMVTIVNAREHNLKGVTARIPLGKWVCVTGVSGSGKSTLIHSVLYEGFNVHARRTVEGLGLCDGIEGLDQLDEILLVDQSPIGRSIRSNPVTYVKAWEPIRKMMASTREARALGLRDSSFSFNVKGGRCEVCEGTGVTTYDMHFLAEVTLPCEACGGKRFEARVLQARYKGKNVHEILSMTVDDATGFFAGEATIVKRLSPLRDVGLGYLTLGQNTSTISGGEAQRLKLAAHLSTGGPSSAKRTMMIFDEPTTGLSLSDLDVLVNVFRRLVKEGYSLVVIEHNLEIIRHAEWILDLGPEGGDGGGELIAEGPPETIATEPHSYTGQFLREML